MYSCWTDCVQNVRNVEKAALEKPVADEPVWVPKQ